MSDTPALVVIEKLGNAVIAHVNVKLLDEAGLKLLGQLIDQSAGEPGVSLVVVDLSGVRLIPSHADSSASRSCSPASRVPSRIASRSRA